MAEGLIRSSLSDARNWALSGSLWGFPLGISCCQLELDSAAGPRFDVERFGIQWRGIPAEADLLIVAGPVNHQLKEELRRTYDEMKHPKYVIAMGSCASTGGMFSPGDEVCAGIEGVVPVDIFIPGCPPRPESVIHALLRLQEKIRCDVKI
ncbi:MAG: NADH-quinone oxidoreductase subunit NuoB [Bdellovibrionales bacterium]|nr:NADH-quinone oxidoreductase subunit NuoB [Bdellovibrionales bacterium]